ncbi:hypothetical protein ACFPOG_12380 [Paenibacillus aestuarii]|uniref:Uncharacterized protein n=1 Tax=Paenibacillus aestuarii TaxID=516965 RepID=A0ABW0K8A8_9BACL
MGVVIPIRKNRLQEMEYAIRTLLNNGVTIDEIKMGSLEALTELVKIENPQLSQSQAAEEADQFITKLFKKVGIDITLGHEMVK